MNPPITIPRAEVLKIAEHFQGTKEELITHCILYGYQAFMTEREEKLSKELERYKNFLMIYKDAFSSMCSYAGYLGDIYIGEKMREQVELQKLHIKIALEKTPEPPLNKSCEPHGKLGGSTP